MKLSHLDNLPSVPLSHNARISKKQLLAYDEVPGLAQFAQAIIPPGECVAAHCHDDMIEVFFVQSGEGIISIDGVDCAITPGASICVDAGEVHALQNTGSGNLVLLYFGLL